jgi:hypothetical protein
MSCFPTAAHAASWTGICPGNHQSAGKRLSGRTRKGDRWLRATLIECARGAERKGGGYPPAQYHHIARRRGEERAIVAVAHSILAAAWHALRDGVDYLDLGPHHFDQLHRKRLARDHQPRLSEPGFKVMLITAGEAA